MVANNNRQKISLGIMVTICVLLAGFWVAIQLLGSSTFSPSLKFGLLIMAAVLCLIASLSGIFSLYLSATRPPEPYLIALFTYIFPAIALILPIWLVTLYLSKESISTPVQLNFLLQPTAPWLFIGQVSLLAVALCVWYLLPEKVSANISPIARTLWMIGLLAGLGLWLITSYATTIISGLALNPISSDALPWSTLPLPVFAFVAFVSLVVAPPAEEYLFRHLLIQSWQPRLGTLGAAAASAALFATLLGRPFLWVPAFLVGMGLYTVVETTGHLRAAIFAHVVFNVLALCINWTTLL
jgi:membrane protease YdiL (CAAX protease family)